MKSLAIFAATLLLGFTLVTGDAEAARRLGGAKSTGMQRESVSPTKPSGNTAAPSQAAAPAAAAPAPASPTRSWMGPLAGLAAGLGLAALASHLGFGQGLANILLIGLMIMVVLAIVGYFMRRRAAAQNPVPLGANGLQYAPVGSNRLEPTTASAFNPSASGGGSVAPEAAKVGNIPSDFDVDSFIRQAKVNFIRLQAANDAGNIDDIREFTTPEMFGEIKMSMSERGQSPQETDVVSLNGEVLDVAEEPSRYVVSVHFSGLIREDRGAQPQAFDEIWHLIKPRDGSQGWVLAGIQQIQ